MIPTLTREPVLTTAECSEHSGEMWEVVTQDGGVFLVDTSTRSVFWRQDVPLIDGAEVTCASTWLDSWEGAAQNSLVHLWPIVVGRSLMFSYSSPDGSMETKSLCAATVTAVSRILLPEPRVDTEDPSDVIGLVASREPAVLSIRTDKLETVVIDLGQRESPWVLTYYPPPQARTSPYRRHALPMRQWTTPRLGKSYRWVWDLDGCQRTDSTRGVVVAISATRLT